MTVTNIMSQLFIFSVMSRTINEAFTFLTTSATLAYLIPYIVSSIYSFKVIMQGDTYELQKGNRTRDGIIALVAMGYSAWVIISGTADLKTFGLGIGLFLVGILLYPFMSKGFAKETV